MRIINKVFQNLKLLAICSAFLFATGCALQKGRLDDQRIIIEDPRSTSIHFNSIQARQTDKGLQIYGSLKSQLSWPRLTRTHVNIEVLSADGQVLKQTDAKVRQRRGRGYRKRFYDFSKSIPGTYLKDVQLNLTLQPDLRPNETLVNANLYSS
jgi:hypothetical protein